MTIRSSAQLRVALWVIGRMKALAMPLCAGDRALLLYAADRVRDDVRKAAEPGLQSELPWQ